MARMKPVQLYLPEDLRTSIDEIRQYTGESLGAYMRRALEQRLKEQKRKAKKH